MPVRSESVPPVDLGLVLGNSYQPFAAGTPDGKLIYFNHAFCELTGYSPDELDSVSWTEGLTPPEWQSLMVRVLEELHRTGRPERHEQDLARKDGSLVPVEVFMHEVRDELGEVAYNYAFVTDVSERKQAEALRSSEILHRLVAENSHDWEIWIGPERRYFYCSPSSEHVCGYRPQEFEADPGLLRRIVHPDDLPLFDAHEAPGSGLGAIRFRILTRTGQERWIEHVCQSIYDADGTFLGRRASNRDVTDRVRAEQERERLLEEVESLARFPGENPHPVMRIDSNGLLLYANQAATRLGGREVPGPGQPVAVVWRRAAQETLRAGLSLEIEQTAGDRIYWLQFVPVVEAGYVNVYGRDVTARRHAETERERLLAENREQRAFLEAVLDSMAEAVRVHDPEGRILLMNPAAQRLLNYTPEQMHQPFRERIADRPLLQEDGQRFPLEELPVARALGGETVRGVTVGLEQPGEEIRWFSYSAAPVHGADGSLLGAVVTSAEITELRRTQERLEEARAQAETAMLEAERHAAQIDALFSTIPTGVIVYGRDGRIVRMNQVAAGYTAYPNQGRGMSVRDRAAVYSFLREDGSDLPFEEWPAERALRGEVVRQEIIGRTDQAGELVWRTTSAAPIRSHDGSVTGAVLSFHDITELRLIQDKLQRVVEELAAANEELQVQAEELAAQNEELTAQRDELARLHAQLDATIDATVDGLIIFGSEGGPVRANTAAIRLLGLNITHWPESAEDWARLLNLTDEAGLPIRIEDWPPLKALRDRSAHTGLVSLKVPSGEIRWLSVAAAPILAPDRRLLGVVTGFTDVTELRQARERLQQANEELQAQAEELTAQNEELLTQRDELERLARELELERSRLRTAIDGAPMAVVVADSAARVVMANRRAEELYGRPVPIGQEYASNAAMQVCHPDGTPCDPRRLPLTRSALDGEVCRNEHLTIVQPDGQRCDILAASAPIWDGGGRVAGAVAMFEDVTALKNLERERESLERAKDEFLSVISHELRTPLASILGYSEILLGEQQPLPPPEVQEEFLRTIFDSAGRLSLLIDDLVDLTRLGQHSFRLMLEPVHINGALERAVELMRPMAQEKEQHIELRQVPDEPVLIADAQRLGQVLANLVSNAVKFSPNGSTISLVGRCSENEICIEVIDAGPGISPDDMPYLFERFYRGRNAGRASGTGLGLYIAREIVQAHGGRIEVDSEPDLGSTFRVRLPLERSAT